MSRRLVDPRFARPSVAVAILVAALALALVACAEETPAGGASAVSTRLPVFATATTATPEASAVAGMTDTEVSALLRELICWYDAPRLAKDCLPVGPEVAELLQQIAESGDPRFVAPLIDMLWIDLGWDRWVAEALTAITGLKFPDAYGWSAWIAAERPSLPNGYLTWKGHLLSLVDDRFTDLLSADLRLGVRPEELIWSRTAIDEQVPLVAPKTVHRVEERYLLPFDVVYGVFLNGEAHAYPERILGWHEVVTDEVGGRPLVVTHCVPCGGAVAYNATASDGVAYEFGNSGLVYHSRRLFYDHQTQSLWDQLTGDAIAGDAFAAGASLSTVPLLRTTWAEWAGRHPNTTVLSLDTGVVRNYDAGAALVEDQSTDAPLFPAPASNDASIAPKDRVIGVQLGGAARAYSVAAVEAAGIVHDAVGGQSVVLVSRGPGLGVAVYEEYDITFSYLQGALAGLELVDTAGERWFLDEAEVVSVIDSRQRNAIPGRLAYWFAWSDAFPDTTLWSG
ncbi:MAG: DUF3179 domain-containing (seleno)protein [Chloroflexi bacterium]|nr:DUF3179 domain-containing (seleno)protein [Chloroflexota bacterium]MDA1145552.1 DUF3179 domain-containing (seleno)protein [Chloroflexota bacterium]